MELTEDQIEKIFHLEFTMDLLFRDSPILLTLAGNDGYFKKVSDSWQKITGFTSDEMMGKTFFHFIHPDDIEKTLDAYKSGEVFNPDQPPVMSFFNRYKVKSGGWIELEWFSSGRNANDMNLGIAIPRKYEK